MVSVLLPQLLSRASELLYWVSELLPRASELLSRASECCLAQVDFAAASALPHLFALKLQDVEQMVQLGQYVSQTHKKD